MMVSIGMDLIVDALNHEGKVVHMNAQGWQLASLGDARADPYVLRSYAILCIFGGSGSQETRKEREERGMTATEETTATKGTTATEGTTGTEGT